MPHGTRTAPPNRGEILARELTADRSAYGVEDARHAVRVGHGMLEGHVGTAGVDPLADVEQPEGRYIGSQPQLEVADSEEAFAAAERWYRRAARHRGRLIPWPDCR
jgi:hypothetical protein